MHKEGGHKSEEMGSKYVVSEKKETLLVKYMRVVGAVALYWSVSISMVFINKYLLKSDQLKLNAPMFVTWFQCVVTVLLCVICSHVSASMPNLMTFPSTKFDAKLSREALPLSVVFVLMISFNNLCLGEVGVAFYTIARSLVTIFSLIFTYFILGKKTTLPALFCCGIILGGFFLGVNQQGASLGGLSIKGTLYGVFSSAMVALNAIYIKKVLPSMDNNIWKLTYYNNVNACAMFIPFILLSEISEIMSFPYLFNLHFWFLMCVAGFFGFIMGYVVGFEIKVTTPVTHTVSGVAKACLQTVIAVLYSHESKSALWWFSNIMVLFGTGCYSVVKSMDMKREHTATVVKQTDENDKWLIQRK
uniref:GDP-fucose transporter 1 n=1 Tax=Ciona intestinalis TaxID=7719 RepID=F7AWS8_CIOIN|nr:GDP-fucose transporter 1 [Ciona intestinalis]|eukprot:XP_002125224.2 GDP-fucose transporter 1 [Ciona intestinalis]